MMYLQKQNSVNGVIWQAFKKKKKKEKIKFLN